MWAVSAVLAVLAESEHQQDHLWTSLLHFWRAWGWPVTRYVTMNHRRLHCMREAGLGCAVCAPPFDRGTLRSNTLRATNSVKNHGGMNHHDAIDSSQCGYQSASPGDQGCPWGSRCERGRPLKSWGPQRSFVRDALSRHALETNGLAHKWSHTDVSCCPTTVLCEQGLCCSHLPQPFVRMIDLPFILHGGWLLVLAVTDGAASWLVPFLGLTTASCVCTWCWT